ncbi:DUF6884 domain-containing protein [Halorubrum sp. 2020YC2]|uniref:DUF6884 domain-containing protein n=1 Tax=Halorubrum sp. 2020YC2 TaxID=2836432 RepID=UPI001BE87EF4|nr:DUF6884 domain-containing protein [Halorubrum sp. 2020YC2]QWC20739.1 hypothetical protein KI388_07440 [Halorubrum sp. 2020YC2]
MRILIIDQCSGTKSHPADHPIVDQEETQNEDAESLLQSLGIEGIRAKDLYDGKQQRRITEAIHALTTKGHSVERFFVSAGFGLVNEDQRLPPYEATFNSMSQAEIAEREERFQLTQRLRELIDTGGFDVVFLALGAKYYDTIDLNGLLSSTPVETTVVLFNQEGMEERYEQAISVPARTEEGKKFGSTVVGLKGTYLKNFSAALCGSKDSVTPNEAAEYCLTDSSANSQSGIDNFS